MSMARGAARGQEYLIKIFYFNLKKMKNTKKGKLCQAGNESNQKKTVKMFPKGAINLVFVNLFSVRLASKLCDNKKISFVADCYVKV